MSKSATTYWRLAPWAFRSNLSGPLILLKIGCTCFAWQFQETPPHKTNTNKTKTNLVDHLRGPWCHKNIKKKLPSLTWPRMGARLFYAASPTTTRDNVPRHLVLSGAVGESSKKGREKMPMLELSSLGKTRQRRGRRKKARGGDKRTKGATER